MKRKICKICMWMVIVVSQLSAQEAIVRENSDEITPEIPKKDPQFQELTFIVSSQDLYLDKVDGISVNVDGSFHPVYSVTTLPLNAKRYRGSF